LIEPFLYIIAYLVVFTAGLFCLRSIYRAYRLYKFKYILAFFVYILFDLFQGIFSFTWNYFFELSTNLELNLNLLWLYIVYSVFVYFLSYLSLYLILYMLFALLEIKISKPILYLFFLWGIASLGMCGFSCTYVLRNGDVFFLVDAIIRVSLSDTYIKLAIILFFIYMIRKEKQKTAATAYYYLSLYLLFLYISGIVTAWLNVNTWGFTILPIDLILYLVPLIFIKKFLIMVHGSSAIIQMYQTRLTDLTERYQISKREKEIIYMILQGKSNKEIERELFISQNTVKNHIYNIFQKVGVNSRAQLTRYFITDLEKI